MEKMKRDRDRLEELSKQLQAQVNRYQLQGEAWWTTANPRGGLVLVLVTCLRVRQCPVLASE